jgi:formylglycine-generating enzyme required for sulfatase activity
MLDQVRLAAQILESGEVIIESPTDRAELVFVPAGLFFSGPRARTSNELRRARRFVTAFYIDRFPVTNAQFAQFVQETRHETERERINREQGSVGATWRTPRGPDSTWQNVPDHPVVYVYRQDAEAYAEWAGRRLPTRLEWERAARGVESLILPWGNVGKQQCCNVNSDRTTPVRFYRNGASRTGCYDMVGNVWEWVLGDEGDETYLLIGGSWEDILAGVTLHVRGNREEKLAPTYEALRLPCDGAKGSIGFRCAMDIDAMGIEYGLAKVG